jgi:hypothetical protein
MSSISACYVGALLYDVSDNKAEEQSLCKLSSQLRSQFCFHLLIQAIDQTHAGWSKKSLTKHMQRDSVWCQERRDIMQE